MIDIEKYKNVLDQGLLLDHYSLMCCIRDGGELPKSKRIQGFINLLHKKGYLSNGALTQIAIELIDSDTVVCQSSISPTVMQPVAKTEGLLRTSTPSNDYLDWAKALHQKLQDRLFEKTGKRQARGNVNGTLYSFLPNVSDFSKILLKVIVMYKLKDFDKIDKHLISYIDRKAKENYWFPIVGYYMLKNGTSTMVTEMENVEDEKEIDNDSSVNI